MSINYKFFSKLESTKYMHFQNIATVDLLTQSLVNKTFARQYVNESSSPD